MSEKNRRLIEKIDELLDMLYSKGEGIVIKQIPDITILNPTDLSEIQKIEVINKTVPPEIQKVEVVNTIAPPKIQKVKVTNPVKIPEFPKFPKIPEVKFPKTQEVKGTVSIKNLPKPVEVQKIKGAVSMVEAQSILKGLQVIVNALVEVKNAVSVTVPTPVMAGVTGSHKDKISGITKFDPNDATPNYVGMHPLPNALTSDSDWEILKYTYSGSNVTQIERRKGAWDDRTTLF